MSVDARGDRRARRKSEERATNLLLRCVMRHCRCDEVRGGNDMRSLASSAAAVLLPTWRAVVEGGRGREWAAAALFSSTLPDTTPVDCFISRVESMLQIPQMQSNWIDEGSGALQSVSLAHSLSPHPCQIVRYSTIPPIIHPRTCSPIAEKSDKQFKQRPAAEVARGLPTPAALRDCKPKHHPSISSATASSQAPVSRLVQIPVTSRQLSIMVH